MILYDGFRHHYCPYNPNILNHRGAEIVIFSWKKSGVKTRGKNERQEKEEGKRVTWMDGQRVKK